MSEKIENTNGNDQTNLYVKDENANKISKNIIEGWNYGLLRMTELINFDGNNYTLKTTDNKTNVELLLDDYHKINNLLKNYKNKPNAKLKNGQTYKEYVEANVIKIKEHILSLLGRAGVSVDMATLNSFLIKEYYDPNTAEQLVNLFTDGSNAGLSFLFSNKLKDVLKIEPSGNVPGTFNRHISRYYDDSKFLGRLSETYGMTHPNSDELSVLSTDGKLLYPISDHNYLTDMVQNLDNDPATVEALTKVLYNTGNNANPNYFKGSYLLTNLYNNPTASGKIGVETLVYFKEQGSGDKGRKYTEISPLEDYIAKMTLTQKGRIVLPTMGDSQTYNTLYGTAINNFNQPLDTTNNQVKFNAKVLTRFINYFETELDTIEFNYKNENNLTEEQKVKNYDTGNRNGYRFRYFNGFFKLKERPTLNGIEFEKDFSNFNEALDLAEDLGGNEYGTSIISQIRNNWNKFSNAEKANLMNNYLWDAFKDELNYAQELGIIKWDGNKIASVTSLALPQKALEEASSHYKKSATVSNYSENLGAAEMIGNYFANTISSVIEFEKLFIKDPAYYKNPVDKIKRLREVLSTGVTPRIDYEEGNPMADLTEVNVGTLSDNVIVSRQADQIAEYAKRSAAIRLLQEMHNMTLDEAIRTYDSSEALPQDVEDAANLIVRDKFNGYLNPKGKVNQTDATVLISPEFYKELVRRVDGWTPQVAKAFDLLNNPNADLEADMDTYAEALAVTLKPLKFMYFGDHYDVGAKRDIPIFDKMAMFPVHRIFSTGDMGKVLEVMQSRNIHMLAFDSAVKVGQRAKEVKSRIYKDKTNKEIDMDSLMSMPTHKQSLTNFRRQLITDPHHAERQMFVSQAQKAAMGNIRSAWKYTTPDGKVYSGDELINNFNGAHNAITEAGRKEIERDFGITPDKPQVSVQRFAEIMQRKALSSNMNDNVINGLDVENGETVAPISGLSDNSWIESGLISMLNKSIVDTNLPGGMFIQMSSILYNRIAVTSDVQNERKLRFANTDGTMDCVISINLLKHIIPDYDKKTFSEAKKWLIDHGIVGPNSKAIAMGYRIPAQGQASTAALKVIDLYPEQIGDTITLPDEFTSLTGSDFDIDKLFVARYNYDKNGNRIKFETKEDYTNRLREAGLDDETIVRKVYERYNGKTDFEANSKEANENMLLDMYISVISNPLNFAEARQPLDTVTDYLKDTILKEVDTITGQGKRTSKSQLYYATPAFQSRTKAELNGGKFGIGPFALANAHQVLTQLVKLRFKPNKILRDYGISNLYGIQSNDRNKINILDWLSALINAHVDVAKDPYIIRLNVRKLTFNMTNFLIRSGKGESTFYFLPQQILKDFAIEYDKYSGFYNVDTQNKNPESLAYRTIWNTYFEKAKSLSKGKYDQLLDFLNDKGVGVKQREKMFDVNYLKKQLKKEETFDWYYNQLLIMKTYQELNPFSRSLSELTTLSQIDTKRFGNNFGLQSAFLDKWKQFMVEQQVFEDPIKVFSNTFLGKKMQDALIFPRIAFQNTMIRLTPEFENLRTLIEFYTKGYAISDDTYINNITRSMEATYKAGFFNKYLAENGIKLSSLLGGPNSISKRLDRIKSDVRSGKYPDLLSSDGSFENVLINNIFSRPKEDTTELNGPDFIAYKPNKSGDNNLENEIIRAWEELWDSDYQEIRDFAKDLALYAFYTSGDAFGKNNIFRYVPNSIREEIGYFDYIRDLERNPDDAVKDIKVFQVIKDLWWNDHVVPTIDYYVLDSSRETIEEEGRPVYRALPHEDSGFTVVNKRGAEVQIPGIIYDKKSQSIISFNQNGQPIFPPFKKVKLDRNNDPRTTFLYEYIGINEDEAPVYRLINKKGIAYRGNVLIENGRSKSVLKYNNVVPKGYEIMPEEPITWVTDLTPVKASLRAKAFNKAGEFNTDMLANIQQTVKTQQATEPLSYQELVKDYQTQKGEADAEAAYQQYLDNFEYNKPQIDEQSPIQPNASTNLAEAWSQKEGWSTEYFNSKVLPKINEAWQIEYELAPDQSVPAKFKGNMTFDYGEHGRPGLKSKSTIEAVRNGERTATTRYESQGHLDYWKQAQVGDVIEWKRGNESVKVLVTKPLTKLRTSDAIQQDLFASEQPIAPTFSTSDVKQPAITDTTKEFLDYANQFGFTDEAALLAKDLPKASEEAKKVEEEYVFTFNDGFKINLPFSLNDQQKSALYELEKFIEDYGTEITLSGYAGTGKSTIIGIFSKWLDHRIGRGNIVYTAPIHRANVITKQNNPNANVYTLSALFGFTPDTDEAMERESLDLRELEFRAKNQVKYEPGQLIIIDEASMVQDGLYEYIQKIVAKDGVSVIYVGDSAQLRPVKSDHISKVFTSDGVPQITLTKVERTGDNPILKEATRLRRGEGLSYQTDINDKGQGVLYTSNDTVINENLKQIISSEEFNADPLHFRVITATNAAAATYNSKIRSLRYGKFAKPFVKGDILMGYSNKLRKPDGSYRLINSMDYIVQNVRDTTVKFKTDKGDIEFKAFKLSIRPIGNTIMDDFHITVIDKNEPDSKLFEIVEYKDRLWRMAKEAKQDKQISKYRDLVQMAFNIDNELNITKNLEDNQGRLKIRKAIDYGYAQTVWKSQGSTYSKVLILSNEIDTFGYGRDVMQLRNELRYVAVSRAKNFVIINSEAENKKKVSMRNEIAEEDLLDDIEFEPATEEQAIKASLQDSIDELTANGKQRRKECE